MVGLPGRRSARTRQETVQEFAQFYGTTFDPIYRFVLGATDDPEVTETIVADTYRELWHRWRGRPGGERDLRAALLVACSLTRAVRTEGGARQPIRRHPHSSANRWTVSRRLCRRCRRPPGVSPIRRWGFRHVGRAVLLLLCGCVAAITSREAR